MSASYLKKPPNDIPLTITISNVVLASCAPAFLKLYVLDASQACSFEMGHFRPRDDPSGRQFDTSPSYLWSPLNLDSSAPQVPLISYRTSTPTRIAHFRRLTPQVCALRLLSTMSHTMRATRRPCSGPHRRRILLLIGLFSLFPYVLYLLCLRLLLPTLHHPYIP